MSNEKDKQEEFESLESENDRLKQAYQYIHASRNSVDAELNEANEEIAKLRSELAKQKEENELLKQRIEKDFDLIDLREKLDKQEELLPCPFCGGEAKMTQIKSNGFMIKCSKCLIQRRQKVLRYPIEWLQGKMIEDWNTRSELAKQKELNAELVETDQEHEHQRLHLNQQHRYNNRPGNTDDLE